MGFILAKTKLEEKVGSNRGGQMKEALPALHVTIKGQAQPAHHR